jgi:hypothetical protein
MSITTYGELKTAVGSWLNRSDLTSYVADFVRLAEQRIYFGSDGTFQSQPLRVPAMEAQTTGTVTGGSSISFPTRYLEAIRFQVSNGSTSWSLDYITPVQYARESNNTGYPSYYTYLNNTIVVDGDSSVSYTLDYYQSLDLFTTDSDTNWILTNAPGIYLYASLLEAEPFLRDDNRLQIWHGMLRSAASALNRSTNKQVGPLAVRAA